MAKLSVALDGSWVKAKFTNELGNPIIIDISSTKENNQDRILICIEGPHSVVENTLTQIEAEELLKALAMKLDYTVSK